MKTEMKNFLKKAIIVLIILSTVLPFAACDTGKGKTGLYVNNKGKVYLGDKPFYGFGLNMFSTFQYHLLNLDSDEYDDVNPSVLKKDVYKEDFALCTEYGIPLVRMPFCSLKTQAYEIFDTDREKFFRAMDDVVEEAEKCHVGIIASLLWHQDALACYVKETRSEYGNPNSKITEFAKNYVSAIVERYKDSPAVFGWEIGNEYNLNADLCDAGMQNYQVNKIFKVLPPSYYDYYTSGELLVFYNEISETIRSIDKDRLLTTGNGENRNFSYAAKEASLKIDDVHYWTIDWTKDSRKQFEEMIMYFTPDPIDTICFHFCGGSSGDIPPHANDTHELGDCILNTKEYIKLYLEVGKKNHKCVFYGEFGDMLDMEKLDKVSEEDFRTAFTELVNTMYGSGLQIACGWFNWSGNASIKFNHTLTDLSEVNKYKLEELHRINEQFKDKGKQQSEKYWNSFE